MQEYVQKHPYKFNMIRMASRIILVFACTYVIITAAMDKEPFYNNYFSFMSVTCCAVALLTFCWVVPVRYMMGGATIVPRLTFLVLFLGVIGFIWGVIKVARPGGAYHEDCGHWELRPE